MKLNRITIVWTVSLILLAVFSLAILRKPTPAPANEPTWVKHYHAAQKAIGNDAERKRLAKLVLSDSAEYGGKMPPPEPISLDQAQLENAFWFFPLPDRGHTMSYTEALGNLAFHFRNAKEWDDAELFHRKILELQEADWRAHPKTARIPDPSILIDILNENGKKKEAIELQKKVVADAVSAAAKQPGYTELQTSVFMQRAKLFELQGKISDAEGCWLKILDLYKSELTDESLAQKKRQNANASISQGYSSNLFSFRYLEDLGDFYRRHNNAAGEERTLLKLLALRKAIVPDNYPGLSNYIENLATFYEKHKEYDKAANMILQIVRCRETAHCWERLANAYLKQGKFEDSSEAILKGIHLHQITKEGADKGPVASLYFWNSQVLQKAGRQRESAQAKEMALKIDPTCTGYYQIWN